MKERRRRRMIERAQPLLPPGSEIRQIFGAQTKSVWLMAGLMALAVLPGALVFAGQQAPGRLSA